MVKGYCDWHLNIASGSVVWLGGKLAMALVEVKPSWGKYSIKRDKEEALSIRIYIGKKKRQLPNL